MAMITRPAASSSIATRRSQRRNTMGVLLQYMLAIAATLLFVTPIYWAFATAFKTEPEAARTPPTWYPHTFTLDNFSQAWRILNLGPVLLNTIFVSVVCTMLIVFFSALAGYAFAKGRFIGQNILLIVLIGTMTIPPGTLMIPIFQVVRDIGLLDSLWALILPFSVTAFGIFMMRQFISQIPNELLEAARIDGLSEFGIFMRVVLPLVKPGLAAVAIIEFVNNWNSFIMPLVLINDPNKYTLTLALGLLTRGYANPPWILIMAVVSISMVPVIIMYLLLQRFFTSGALSGAVKG